MMMMMTLDNATPYHHHQSMFSGESQDGLGFSYLETDANCSHFDLFNWDEEEDIGGWKRKHPENWTSEDIINWIYSVALSMNLNFEHLSGERFQNLNGHQLCQLTVEGFTQRDQVYGLQLFKCLQELRQGDFIPASELSDIEDLCQFAESHKYNIDNMDYISSPSSIPDIRTFLDPIEITDPYPILIDLSTPESGYESGASSSSPIYECPTLSCSKLDVDEKTFEHLLNIKFDNACNTGIRDCCTTSSSSSSSSPTQHPPPPPPPTQSPNDIKTEPHDVVNPHPPPLKRRPGRPPKRSPSTSSSSDENLNPEASKKRKTKTTHLWKFMRALLEDPAYNPSSIKWENKKEGVFRIVPGQSKVIAKLWGQRKNNPSMTFDKLSRSLRWCRTYGFLSEVPKNGNYPKKLCFRFGQRAADWEI